MKKLLCFTLAGAAVLVFICLLVPAQPGYRVEQVVIGILSGAAAARTALGFGRSDHLRRAWGLTAISGFVIGVSEILPLDQMPASGIFLTFVVNVCGVVSMVHFARAFAVAGLDLPGTRARNIALYVAIFVVAVLIVAVPMVDTLRRLAAGNMRVAMRLVSSAGDLATLTLIGPVLLTALALRGGLLVWPWALLVAANIGWLLFDASELLAAFGIREDSLLVWANLWQVLACFLTIAAAEAQRRVSQGEASPT